MAMIDEMAEASLLNLGIPVSYLDGFDDRTVRNIIAGKYTFRELHDERVRLGLAADAVDPLAGAPATGNVGYSIQTPPKARLSKKAAKAPRATTIASATIAPTRGRAGFVYRASHKSSLSLHPKKIRYLYRTRVKKQVPAHVRENIRQWGLHNGPILKEARAIAKSKGRNRITKADYLAAGGTPSRRG